MRVFVTGGTGFIGGHVVRLLAERGHEIVALARGTSDLRGLERSGAQIVIGDLNATETMRSAMQDCDWAVHLAACFEFWLPDRRTYHEVNVVGTRNFMTCAVAAGVRKVIHVSTAAVYGDAAWPITEETPWGTRCASEYARTKRAAEIIAEDFRTRRGLPLITIYPGAVTGSGDTKATGRFIRRIALRQMPARVMADRCFSFVHVRDVALAIARALELEANVGEKYLVSGENLTFGQLSALVAEVADVRLPMLRLPDVMVTSMARILTRLADRTRRPPAWDLSADQVELMKQGFSIDASKAARELGVTCTPIRTAVEDVLERLRV